jgi:hypothetical protein
MSVSSVVKDIHQLHERGSASYAASTTAEKVEGSILGVGLAVPSAVASTIEFVAIPVRDVIKVAKGASDTRDIDVRIGKNLINATWNWLIGAAIADVAIAALAAAGIGNGFESLTSFASSTAQIALIPAEFALGLSACLGAARGAYQGFWAGHGVVQQRNNGAAAADNT